MTSWSVVWDTMRQLHRRKTLYNRWGYTCKLHPCTFRIHIAELHTWSRSAWGSPAMDKLSGLVVPLPCVAVVYPHCKLLWPYQPMLARARWSLSCPCSSEQLLPDPQSTDLLLESSCVKHVYTCGRHTKGEEWLTHMCHQRWFKPPLDIAGRECDRLRHGLMWDLYASDIYPSKSLLEHNISDHTLVYGYWSVGWHQTYHSLIDHFLIIQHLPNGSTS